MSKLAQAVVKEPAVETQPEVESDRELLYRKLQKEAEIRMKLDEFARELALAKAEREDKL